MALDDFGAGYSSLGHLRRYPFDKLKIDREFVTDCTGDVQSATVVHAVVSIGRALGRGRRSCQPPAGLESSLGLPRQARVRGAAPPGAPRAATASAREDGVMGLLRRCHLFHKYPRQRTDTTHLPG
jgi:hypothetical protein